jgi:hypothetical protein
MILAVLVRELRDARPAALDASELALIERAKSLAALEAPRAAWAFREKTGMTLGPFGIRSLRIAGGLPLAGLRASVLLCVHSGSAKPAA